MLVISEITVEEREWHTINDQTIIRNLIRVRNQQTLKLLAINSSGTNSGLNLAGLIQLQCEFIGKRRVIMSPFSLAALVLALLEVSTGVIVALAIAKYQDQPQLWKV